MSNDHTKSDESAVRNALHRLDFGTTEAKVLVGLHRLGTATARDVSRVTDVSRPQVYSAIEGLEQRGLINIQQANPKQFQPVSPDETAALLRRTFDEDIELVADHLEGLAAQRDGPDEEREDMWTLRGQEAVSERIVQLIEEATSRIVFGVQDEALLTSQIVQGLRDRSRTDVDVLVLTFSPAIRNEFAADDTITVMEPREHMGRRDHMGRMLLVDHETVLHSMLGDEELPGLQLETAFWSSGSGFASTFIAMMDHFIDENLGH
ncbi:TrmB family transcriptional regulator [Haladaptatus halobius]|uniref:TrmB family transcriptional regulator n=1 Tax=Haladaptatus halobius TaxID=2884875 RepID=UPI001D0AB627|nr:helix-turn-helix domain-containing protein [Haladaptatus halobius]